MSKRFLIAAEGSVDEQRRFLEHLNTRGCGWWHWLSQVWLIEDPNDESEAIDWAKTAADHFSNDRVLVMEIRRQWWAAKLPDKSLEWLRNEWGRSEDH